MKYSRFLGTISSIACLCSPLFSQTVLVNNVGTSGGTPLLEVDDAEITPDGRYIVSRLNTISNSARVYDAATGVELAVYQSPTGTLNGVGQDAMAVTNDRAVALGNDTIIMDLTNLALPALAIHNLGDGPRDLDITPDGSLVAIRGGHGIGAGLYVIDLVTGIQVAFSPGDPRDLINFEMYDVDSVVASNEFAAFLSSVTATGSTRVTIMSLHPTGGGNPVVSYETGTGIDIDLAGPPHDLAMTPDGTHLAVRSESSVALYDLTGSTPQMVWVKRLYDSPGPMGLSAMDSVEVTNTHIATISRWANGGFGAQVDIFDMAGNQSYEVINGDPHDLTITPNGEKLLVRTHTHVYMYRLPPGYPGLHIHYKSRRATPSTHTNYGAGMDSLVATNEVAVTLARNDETADIDLWDISGFSLTNKGSYFMNSRPVDLEITPSGSKVVVSGFAHTKIFDLLTFDQLLNFESNPGGGYPWCDGVIVNDATAMTYGSVTNGAAGSPASTGWMTIVDLFQQPSVFCASNANSTGAAGRVYATGSASVGGNNLHLVAHDMPASAPGVFIYGNAMGNTPFGSGVLCVAGQSGYFAPQMTSADGMAELAVDSMNLPQGTPAIVMGTSRFFQFLFRDRSAGAGVTNTTEGLGVQFTL